ncbi:hypothetical protein TRICI_000353 [Trichomonascus ciferrii]|uniref:Cleavage and polyadenylation specificity factor subunit 5 n=1 Tax=Trichomonascus ciferrii TaxID=44093 RepID=A0A642VDN3_9ASCO|nr:hypothetical protein TRICI_000353 [Trichomonascus ciferrii]
MTTIRESSRKTTIVPHEPRMFNERQSPTIRLYPVKNYTFGIKARQPEEDPSVAARLHRLKEHYEDHGMRRTCEGVLICHERGHPFVLLLKIANAFYKLPGDYLNPGEDELEGFTRLLRNKISPEDGSDSEWDVGECIAQWWRPNFESFMYPFIPPHITRPKECKKMYLAHLPRNKTFSIPQNMKMVAVPLFELYDNATRYGSQLAAIPIYLSKYNFEFIDENDNIISSTPAKS